MLAVPPALLDILHLKPGTVAFHKYRIMASLGLTSNAELIEYALRKHMLA